MTAHAARAVAGAPARVASFRRVALQAWVILFVAAAGTMLASTAQVRPIVHVVWATPVLLLAVRARLALPASMTWATAGVLAAYGVACLASRNPWASLETAGFAAAAAAWFVVAAAMTAASRTAVARAVLLALTAWLAVLAAVWAVDTVSWVAAAGWPPPAEPTRNYVWLVGNSIPVVALLALPLVRWIGSDPVDRWLTRSFLGAAAAAVLLSGGIIGFAGVGVAAVGYVALGVIRTRRAAAVALASLAILVLAAAAAVLAAVVLDVGVPLPSTAEARLLVWQQGAEMLASDPLTGTGPGTTALVRREFVPDHGAAVLTDHLHSVPLQAAAEGGLLLLAALVAAAVAWARALWRVRRHDPPTTRLVVACVAGASVTFLGDSFLDLPVVVALLLTVAAWSAVPQGGEEPAEGRASPRPGRAATALRAAIVVLAVVSVVPVASADAARLAASAGRSEARRGDWPAALAAFRSAASLNPTNPLYRLEVGEAAREVGDTTLAAAAFEQATAMAPADGRTWGALAAVTDDRDDRIRLLTTAAERADGDPQFAFRLARELEAAGRVSEAVSAYAEAVALHPELIAALPSAAGGGVTRGEVLAALPAVADAIADRARLDPDVIRWDLQLLAGELDPEAPAAWQAVAAAAAGDAVAAREQLATARRDAPTDARTWQAAAAVARLTCDATGADAALRMERMLVGSHQFQRRERLDAWERVYREPGLGDFQPDGILPPDARWPAPFVALDGDCG